MIVSEDSLWRWHDDILLREENILSHEASDAAHAKILNQKSAKYQYLKSSESKYCKKTSLRCATVFQILQMAPLIDMK
ncbi:MAG: hypothetical protein EZS28_019968 [Streblomastix strix]|uniref:Uncharacterized protein n=1 Tax=Streblomastix strix TaxID=222440 RepID=A0A5J4VPU2_9EUKA|nr:MAG: hypothetical protein EZS28_019968 [Streblomastix strix]